jgi:DNA modification methylase
MEKLSKNELLGLVEKAGFKNYKSKNKKELIAILESPKKFIDTLTHEIKISNEDGLLFLEKIEDNSVDLILTDPPYIVSRETGMNKLYNQIKDSESRGIEFVKSEEDWEEYIAKNDELEDSDENKTNFMKYGTIYGKKYSVKTDYGEWDSKFTMELLEKFIEQYFKKLKKGGTWSKTSITIR